MSAPFDNPLKNVIESDYSRAHEPITNRQVGAPPPSSDQSDTLFDIEVENFNFKVENADDTTSDSQWEDQFDHFLSFPPSTSPVTSPAHEPQETPLLVDTGSIRFPEPIVPKSPLDMPDVNGVTNWEKLRVFTESAVILQPSHGSGFSDSSRQGSSDAINSFYSPQNSSSSHTLLTSPTSTSPLQGHQPYSSSDEHNHSNEYTTQESPIAIQYSSGDESARILLSPSSELPNSFAPSSFPSGYTSDSGYPLPPQHMPHHHSYHGDTLTVPPLVSSTRGRAPYRVSRHAPYSRNTRSRSVTSIGDLDLEMLRIGRSRSPSVVSTASSRNADADISDNDGYYSSQEHYPPRRQGHSPTADPAEYRETVGSNEIVRASTGRRTHEATHFCTQPDCGASFTTKQNLNNHINSHFGIRPYSCNWCEKSFTTAHTRDRHLRSCKRKHAVNQHHSLPGPSRA